jgi:hypothetical protein
VFLGCPGVVGVGFLGVTFCFVGLFPIMGVMCVTFLLNMVFTKVWVFGPGVLGRLVSCFAPKGGGTGGTVKSIASPARRRRALAGCPVVCPR